MSNGDKDKEVEIKEGFEPERPPRILEDVEKLGYEPEGPPKRPPKDEPKE